MHVPCTLTLVLATLIYRNGKKVSRARITPHTAKTKLNKKSDLDDLYSLLFADLKSDASKFELLDLT